MKILGEIKMTEYVKFEKIKHQLYIHKIMSQ